MSENLMEAGQVVGTHGIRGEVKVNPWCDSPEFLADFSEIYIDGRAIKVLTARVHKNCVLMALDGVSDVNAAMLLRNKVVFINKIGLTLPDGQYFIADLIGLSVYSKDACIGKIKDVLTLPANDVYVVSGDDGEYMIPVVREFVHEIDMAARRVNVTIIPGMKGL